MSLYLTSNSKSVIQNEGRCPSKHSDTDLVFIRTSALVIKMNSASIMKNQLHLNESTEAGMVYGEFVLSGGLPILQTTVFLY